MITEAHHKAFIAECEAFQDAVKESRRRDGCTYQLMAGLYEPILCRAQVINENTDYCEEHHPVILAELERLRTDPLWRDLLRRLSENRPSTALEEKK